MLEKLLVPSSTPQSIQYCALAYFGGMRGIKRKQAVTFRSSFSLPLAHSQQPVPERLRIRVSRISMRDYEALNYDKEKLKEACE